MALSCHSQVNHRGGGSDAIRYTWFLDWTPSAPQKWGHCRWPVTQVAGGVSPSASIRFGSKLVKQLDLSESLHKLSQTYSTPSIQARPNYHTFPAYMTSRLIVMACNVHMENWKSPPQRGAVELPGSDYSISQRTRAPPHSFSLCNITPLLHLYWASGLFFVNFQHYMLTGSITH
jgi:hypothetical protein